MEGKERERSKEGKVERGENRTEERKGFGGRKKREKKGRQVC